MIADLSSLGFFGFAAVTFSAGTVCCGWFTEENRGLYHAFLMVGGIAQVLGGMVDIIRRNAAGGVILTGFGLYWMGEAIAAWPGFSTVVGQLYEDPAELRKLVGVYKMCWAAFTLPMIYTMFRASVCQGVTLFLVGTIFFLHGLTGFLTDGTRTAVERMSGYLMLVAAALAYYMGCGIYLKASGCKGLPFGRRCFVNEDDERRALGSLTPEDSKVLP